MERFIVWLLVVIIGSIVGWVLWPVIFSWLEKMIDKKPQMAGSQVETKSKHPRPD